MYPGTTQLTRIWYSASSTAIARVRLSTPPFEAMYAARSARARPGRVRTDIDDRPSAAGDHLPGGILGTQRVAAEIDGQHFVEERDRHVQEAVAQAEVTGVVHEHIQPAHLLLDEGKRPATSSSQATSAAIGRYLPPARLRRG